MTKLSERFCAVDCDAPLWAIEEVIKMEEEIERLLADVERYRWLRGGPEVPPHSTRWPRWEVRYWDGRYWQTLFAEQLDAAIDAAMNEEGK